MYRCLLLFYLIDYFIFVMKYYQTASDIKPLGNLTYCFNKIGKKRLLKLSS